MPDSRDRGLHRHGDPDPSRWNEGKSVTGRPADTPPANSTMAERAAARGGAKRIDAVDVEDKAVQAKAPAKTKARKRS